jgi:hypothetical protein
MAAGSADLDVSALPEDEALRCSECGGAGRYVKVGRSLILLGHIRTPKGIVHPFKFVPASRSAAKHHSGARAALVRGPQASQPSGTPDTSPRQRRRGPDEAVALSNDRTSIPSGRSSPAGRSRAAEVIPPALVAPRAPRSAGRS